MLRRSDDRPTVDRAKLERAVGLGFSFHTDDEAQGLLDLTADWLKEREKWGEEQQLLLRLERWRRQKVKQHPSLARLGKWHQQQVKPPGSGGGSTVKPGKAATRKQVEFLALSLLVEMVADIWREHGGRGKGTNFIKKKRHHEGPLIRLVEELLFQAGVQKWPSAHTIHRARVEMDRRLAAERASK
jgi:hypothetical protein